jgi:uncharacterized protein DUF6101
VGGPPAGSSRTYRLDPDTLRAQPAAIAAGGPPVTIDVDRRAVVFGANGVPNAVPLGVYRGVAVRMEASGEPGQVRVFLDLLHSDPTLTVPLSAADDPEGTAADWQKWGRVLSLPLLVVAADGTVSTPVATLGALRVSPAKARRRPAHFRARRPRFLVRRKPGRAVALGA